MNKLKKQGWFLMLILVFLITSGASCPGCKKDYSIISSAGNGGNILPLGLVKVEENDDKQYAIISGDGYSIADVKVDGSSVGSVKTYIFLNVTSDHTIDAFFSKLSIVFNKIGNPVNNSVYLEKASINNDNITLAVKIKGGVNVYGSVIQIKYDGSKIKYESSATGDYLGEADDILFYPFLVSGQDGLLHIAIDKKGKVAGSNGDGTLATIVLKVLTEQVNTPITFDIAISNLMPSTSNIPIPGTSWFGGSLSYQ